MQEFERFGAFPQSYGHLVEKVANAVNILDPKIKTLVAKRLAEDLYLDFKDKSFSSQDDRHLITELRGKFVIFDLIQNQVYLSTSYKFFQLSRLLRNYFQLLTSLLRIDKEDAGGKRFHLFFGIPQTLVDSEDGLKKIQQFFYRHFSVVSENDEVLISSSLECDYKDGELNVTTASNFAIYIFRNSLSAKEKRKVFYRYTFEFVSFFISFFLNSNKSVLAGEHIDYILFAYPEYVKRIATLNVTQTMLLYTPIIFDIDEYVDSPRCMWWYSANNVPFEFKNGSKTYFDPSIYSQATINNNYVWSNSQIKFVSSISGISSKSVGSILFYLMQPPSHLTDQHDFVLTIFDVTPYLKADKRDFYTSLLCEDFLLNAVAVARDLERELGINIRIQVKSKRQRSPKHDPRYFHLLESLSRYSSVVMLSEELNLYNLIYESDLVVSIPFTSPALVALELKVPVCYFLESEEFRLPNFWDDVPVFTTKDSFCDFFRRVLKNHG